MSDAEPTADSQPANGKLRRAKAATRVDAAHAVSGGSREEVAPREDAAVRVEAAATSGQAAVPVDDLPPAEAMTAATTIRQVRAQAAQLANHLQKQQASVDHREAELNARLAAMENEIRAARLWLNERNDALAQRSSELDERARELDQREAALSATADGRKPRKARPLAAAQHEQRSAELDRRQAELDELSARLSERFSTVEHARDFEHAMRALETRSQNLQRAEKLLADEQAQLEEQRRLLAAQRTEFAASMQAERAKLADDMRLAETEQNRARTELEQQSVLVSAQQRALEGMRSEILRAQQEAIELRLVTEETWAKLCGKRDAASLAQSIAQLRLRLAAEHRRERGELAQQRQEVQALTERLAAQHAKWAQQRDDVQAWVLQRQQDFERQAAVLVAAGSQLEEDRAAMCEERLAWQFERSRLQAEIRALLGTARRPSMAA